MPSVLYRASVLAVRGTIDHVTSWPRSAQRSEKNTRKVLGGE
jgi:hypothetical protein